MDRKILFLFVTQAIIVQVFTIHLNPAVMQYLQSAGFGIPQPRSLPVPIGQPAQYSSMQALAALSSLFGTPTNVNPKAITIPQNLPQAIPSSNILASLTDFKSSNQFPIPISALPALSSESLFPISLNSQIPLGAAPALSSESLFPINPNGQPIDASLLNNLAIALQLLLITNILNSPSQEIAETAVSPICSSPETTDPIVPNPMPYAQAFTQSPANIPVSVKYAHTPNQSPITATTLPSNAQPLAASPAYYPPSNYNAQPTSYPAIGPNANFVGSSSFSDPIMSLIPFPSSATSGRNGLALMSPYEALNPSSSYSEPYSLSSYRPSNSRRDFQSPYSSFLSGETRDAFSMSDFY